MGDRIFRLVFIFFASVFLLKPVCPQEGEIASPLPAKDSFSPGVDIKGTAAEGGREESPGEGEVPLPERMSREISLDLRGMEIIDTLKFLAKQGDLNIVATKNVKGRVTLFLKSVAIKDMIDIILLTNNLAMSVDNNVITIMTEPEYEGLYGEKYMDKRGVKVVAVKYADPKKMGTILNNMKSKIGKVIVDPDTATAILMDTPKKIKEMEDAINMVDIPTVKRIIPTVTKVFELNYAEAGDIKGELEKTLEENVGSVKSDERTNTLVITALPHNMEKVERLIEAFDIQTKSVFIDAQILELTLNDNYYYGIDWSKLFKGVDGLTLDGVYPFTSTSSSYMKLTLGELASDNYEATINLLKDVGKIKIVSSPQIYVNNNEEAKFMVGTREAYVTTTVSTGEVTTTTSESVEFIEVGVNLYVTPVINKEGYVRLHIKPEVSSVRDWLETSEGNKIPIVETSNVETDVLVKDGRTIILAGLIKETEEESESKTPLLGDIPFLGNAFRNVKKEKERKELVILLTPRVVAGGVEKFKKEQETAEGDNKEAEPVSLKVKEYALLEEDKEEVSVEEDISMEAPVEEVKEIEEDKVREDEVREEGAGGEAEEIRVEATEEDVTEGRKRGDLFSRYYQEGLSHEEKGDYKKAIEAYEEALNIVPDSAVINLRLADIYVNHVVDLQKAERYLKKYKAHEQLLNMEEKLDEGR